MGRLWGVVFATSMVSGLKAEPMHHLTLVASDELGWASTNCDSSIRT